MLRQRGLAWLAVALLLLGVAVLLLSGLGSVPKVEAKSREIVVAPTSLAVSEPSGSAPFTIRLTSKPKAAVTIPLSISNSQCAVTLVQVVLDTANWSTGVTVTVSAADDLVADGTQTCIVQTGLSASTDPNYDNLDPADVTVTVLDDDTAGIIVSPTTLTVSKSIGGATFTVFLTSEPTASVSIPLSTSNNQCVVAPWVVTLNEDNWATGATATVTCVDDPAYGTLICVVETGPTSSADPNYDNLDPPDVTITWLDDEPVARVYAPLVARNWRAGPCGAWEVEPNDTPPLLSGVTYCGTFPDDADATDWFYFGLPTAHTVELWLTNIPAGQDYDVVLRDASLEFVGFSGQLGNANEHILTDILLPGRYYVLLYHTSPGGSTQPYHLKVVYQ
jgi:hypothetical protein